MNVFDTHGHVIGQIPAGTSIFVPRTPEYNARVLVESEQSGYVQQKYIDKPLSKNIESLRISSSSFITYGLDETLNSHPMKGFHSHAHLKNSIRRTAKDIFYRTKSDVYSGIIDCTAAVDGSFVWSASLPINERNQLGKYLGELLIGLRLFQTNTDIKRISIPTKSTFSGYDSFVHYQNNFVLPVSSKYGAGARASFFSNILSKTDVHRPKSVIKELICAKKAAGVSSRELSSGKRTKEVLYEFSIRNALGLSNVANAYSVFLDIKDNLANTRNLTQTSRMVLDAANNICSNVTITEQLPRSLTAIFNREAVSRLSACSNSMIHIHDVLRKHQFLQYNLSPTDWCNGQMKFDCVDSSNCRVKLDGSKGIVSDLSSRHGMINYTLYGL